jgi:hypothetical protein
MIYKFKSRACADHIMMGADVDQMMRILGRQPTERGIIEVADMPAALAALEAAMTAEPTPPEAEEDDEIQEQGVTLHQRLWPMVEVLRRSHAAGEPVVWGV